jgi:hypothetical protein
VKIIFQNPGMGTCRYYMSFNQDTPLKNLLASMSELTQMQYVIDEQSGKVTLSGKACQ